MNLEQRWTLYSADKDNLIQRCEQYARWTIPGIMPMEGTDPDSALLQSYVLVGPRLVNNLSNKVVNVLFPQSRPFFSVTLDEEVKKKIRQEAGEEALAVITDKARKEARWMENYALSKMNLVEYRPVAIDTVQQLIVCGNALIRRLPDESRVVYGVRDYCIRRALNGQPMHIVLREQMQADELDPAILSKLQAEKPHLFSGDPDMQKPLKLFTYFHLNKNKWHQSQEIDGVSVGEKVSYTKVDFPCIPLAWSLRKGEHYGRGLVEEHTVVFGNLDRTGEALFDLFEIAAEIQFLVRAGSLVDVVEMNQRKRGSYHVGNKDDITAVQVNKYQDLQVLTGAAERMERELSFIFLSGAGVTRQAERVTAVEIQEQALELETAFGGLYSRLALAWQQREAEYLIAKTEVVKLEGNTVFSVVVTTGLESLSREGELDAFRRAVNDLALLNNVPESIVAVINPVRIATFLFGQRGLNFDEFKYTEEEKAAIQQQQMQQQQQQVAIESQGQAAVAAVKE